MGKRTTKLRLYDNFKGFQKTGRDRTQSFEYLMQAIEAHQDESAIGLVTRDPKLVLGKDHRGTVLTWCAYHGSSRALIETIYSLIPKNKRQNYANKTSGILSDLLGSREKDAFFIAFYKGHYETAMAIADDYRNRGHDRIGYYGIAQLLSYFTNMHLCKEPDQAIHHFQMFESLLPILEQVIEGHKALSFDRSRLTATEQSFYKNFIARFNLSNLSFLESAQLSEALKQKFSHVFIRYHDTRDMVREFSDLFLGATLLHEMRLPSESREDFYRFLQNQFLSYATDEIRTVANDYFAQSSLRRLLGLSASWHINGNGIPNKLRPLSVGYHWHSLLADAAPLAVPDIKKDGEQLVIRCLTSTHALKEESRVLGHCVGRFAYDKDCAAAKCHIFSIRSVNEHGDETILATLQIKKNGDGRYSFADREARVTHKLNEHDTPQEWAASEWFLSDLNKGRFPLNSVLGEIVKPQPPTCEKLPQSVRAIGFHPTPEAIEALFQEYNHKHMRRAAIARDESGRVSFDMDVSKNRFIPDVTFTTSGGQEITVGYQDLTAELFLAATGLRDKIHDIIRTHYPERAAKLEPVWAEQPNAEALWRKVEAAKQRAKYAHNFEQAHPEPSGARFAGRHANGPLPRIHQPVHGGRTGDEQELSVA